nr:Chain E, Histone H3.3 [Homo sapiens]6HGT_F Chain F, Histone H3.3 [Homo sapiens]6HGT_G Chain G, Histone H3.3 [Homo sapiens]6HGT_H Chain H, Histone H3.3 [Homo sapiens]
TKQTARRSTGGKAPR